MTRIQSTGRAFTFVELIVVITTLFVLGGLLLPALAKSRSQTDSAIDLGNVRQIQNAVTIYAAENNDYCPHPTWGTSTTGWLYGGGISSAALSPTASPALLERALSNQINFFRKGQLAAYLKNDTTPLECPTDVRMRAEGNYKTWYFQRDIKLSSYGFTGAMSGYATPKPLPTSPAGITYKLTDFRPSSFLVWEPDETRPFNFNDGAENQENASEGVSLRHSNRPRGATGFRPAMVGTFGLNASYIDSATFTRLRQSPAENDLRCGPGYR